MAAMPLVAMPKFQRRAGERAWNMQAYRRGAGGAQAGKVLAFRAAAANRSQALRSASCPPLQWLPPPYGGCHAPSIPPSTRPPTGAFLISGSPFHA